LKDCLVMSADPLAYPTCPTAPTDRHDLVLSLARASHPVSWLMGLEALGRDQLLAALADFAHLSLPLIHCRPELVEQCLTAAVTHHLTFTGTEQICSSIGLSTQMDALQNILPTPAMRFHQFASAVGPPPSLPGLTLAERQVQMITEQLGSLATSNRLGVGVATLALSEHLWDWNLRYIGDLLNRRPGTVQPVALACFDPNRRDAALPQLTLSMIDQLPAAQAVDRALSFGAREASQILGRYFSILYGRLLTLGR
jgi:hypothetical protein